MKNVCKIVGYNLRHQLSEGVNTSARIKVWDKVGDILCNQMRDKFYIKVTENVDL